MSDFSWEDVVINENTCGQDLANLVGQHGPINFNEVSANVEALMKKGIDREEFVDSDGDFDECRWKEAVDEAAKEKLVEFLSHLSCVIDSDGDRWTEIPGYGWVQYSVFTGTYLDEVDSAEDLVERLY